MLKENTDVGKWSYKETFEYDEIRTRPQFIVKNAFVKYSPKQYNTVVLELSYSDLEMLNKFNSFVGAPAIIDILTAKPAVKIIAYARESLNSGDCVNCHIEFVAITEHNGKKYNKYELKAFKVVDPPTIEMDTSFLE